MKKLLHFAFFIGLIIATGCSLQDENPQIIDSANNFKFQAKADMVVLGKKLNNPFAVENMRTAYQNLKASGTKTLDVDIKTNFLYVKFLPKNINEYDLLTLDSTLELFDYPLDYELKEGGTYYHDPQINAKDITWQYCAVPVDYKFPNIYHETIAELFIPSNEVNERPNEKTSFNNNLFNTYENPTEGNLNELFSNWN